MTIFRIAVSSGRSPDKQYRTAIDPVLAQHRDPAQRPRIAAFER
jgi:hypothetical protein